MTIPPPQPGPEPTPPAPRAPRRFRKRLRQALIVTTALLVVGIMLAWRMGALDALVLARLRGALGCRAAAARVSLSFSGAIVIDDLELRAPGIDGPAGLFLQTRRATIVPVWSSFLSSAPRIESIRITDSVLRILYNTSGALNVSGLSLGSAPSGGLPPEVTVERCAIELGEFGDTWYTPGATFLTNGNLARSAPGATRYTVELLESPAPASSPTPAPTSSPIRLTGEIDIRDLATSLRLEEFNLARLNAILAPSSLQSQWTRMRLAGRLSGAEFSYAKAAGVAATVRLDQVDLNIPIPVDALEDFESELMGPFEELLRMRGVTGAIRLDNAGLHADLAGAIEDLACRVTLNTHGVAVDAPLSVRIAADDFRLADRPRLLPFAPRLVKRNLRRFGGPTALMSGEVNIERGPALGAIPGPITATGFLRFIDGAARFEKFPYPFHNLRGDIVFDEDKVEIRGITGVGPTGARLHAAGLVQPPTEDAGVDITIVVTDVSTDSVLADSMPANRRGFYDALFSKRALDALVARGDLASPDSPAGEATDQGPAAPPRFDLGGVAEIRVHVTREAGEHHEYLTDVRVVFPVAGILPDAFPYPLLARDFTLRITDDGADAHAADLRGLTGLRGDLEARINFHPGAHDDFDITLGAESIPLDRHLLSALELRESETHRRNATTQATEDRPWDFAPSRIVRDLDLAGAAACEAHIFSRRDESPEAASPDEGPETAYAVEVEFAGLTSRPMRDELSLTDLSGALSVTDHTLRLRGLQGRIGAAVLTGDLDASGLGSDDPGITPALTAALELTDLDLAQPVERLVEVFSPAYAGALASLRAVHRPAGLLDASLTLGLRDGRIEYRADLARPRSLAFDALGGRLSILDSSGEFSVTTDALRCEGFVASLAYDDQPAGRLALSGLWPVREEPAAPNPPTGDLPGVRGEMAFELIGGRFDSPIVRSLASGIAPDLGARLALVDLRGDFDTSGYARQSPEGVPSFTGALTPNSLGLTCEGGACDFDQVFGRVTFDGAGGRVEALEAHSKEWSILVDGAWSTDPAITFDLRASIEAQGLPSSLAALLPPPLLAARSALDLRVEGPLSVPAAHFTMTRDSADQGPRLAVNLDAHFTSATADLGLPVSARDATMNLALLAPPASTTASPSAPEFNLSFTASELVAAGLETTDLQAQASSASAPGVYLLQSVHAHSHGGDITLDGSLRTAGAESGPAAYELDLRATRLDFASLLAALAAPDPAADPSLTPALPPTDGAPPSEAVEPGSRGELSASFGLSGEIGGAASRRGRGALRVQGGEVLALPGLSGLLRLSNLQPPIAEPLDNASAVVYLLGDTLVLQRAEVSSSSLMIFGEGTISLPSLDLNLRFNSKGARRGNIFSALIRGIRDEFVTTEVTGTLRSPRSRAVQLPATRRMLGAIFRGEPKRQPPVASPAPPSPSPPSD